MSEILKKIHSSRYRRSFQYGLPFLLLIVGGSFGLKEFAQLRYTFSRKQTVSPEDVEKYGVKMKNPEEVTLETEYAKIQKIDLDDWEMVRGPRPWEEGTTQPPSAAPKKT